MPLSKASHSVYEYVKKESLDVPEAPEDHTVRHLWTGELVVTRLHTLRQTKPSKRRTAARLDQTFVKVAASNSDGGNNSRTEG